MRVLRALRVAVLVLLLGGLRSVPDFGCKVVAAKSCEPDFGWIQRERHNARLDVLLDPIKDSALILHRENPQDREAALFAHRLLRVHTNFSDTCYDHHWTAALTHKLCASFIRVRDWLEDPVTGFCTTEGVAALTTATHSSHCICNGLASLLLACTHHVHPWASDDPFCSSFKQFQTAPICLHAHPFAGFCQLYHPQPTRTPIRKPTAAEMHSTKPKHSSWHRHSQKEAATRWHSNAHHRLQSKQRVSAPQRAPKRPIRNITDSMPHQHNQHGQGRQLALGTLARQSGHFAPGHFDLRKCAEYTGANAQGRSFCVHRRNPLLYKLLLMLAPGCQFTFSGAIDQCDSWLGWMPTVITEYHHLQPRFRDVGNFGNFGDPANQATVIRAKANDTAVSEMVERAAAEFQTEVDHSCQEFRQDHRFAAKIATIGHEWFSCSNLTEL